MTPIQAAELRNHRDAPAMIDPERWMKDGSRTLLYGFTCDRETFHVYADDLAVHVLVYTSNPLSEVQYLSTTSELGLKAVDCAPNKRVYIESSDYEFCKHLIEAGVQFSFTERGSDALKFPPFVGYTHDQLVAETAW